MTTASGSWSHVEGFQTCDNGLPGVHAMGQNGGPNPAVDLPFHGIWSMGMLCVIQMELLQRF